MLGLGWVGAVCYAPGRFRLRVHSTVRFLAISGHVSESQPMSPASNTATPLHDAPDDPLVGAVLAGSYALGEVMARGGMGVLYSAEHTRLGTPLVVKVLRKRYASL